MLASKHWNPSPLSVTFVSQIANVEAEEHFEDLKLLKSRRGRNLYAGFFHLEKKVSIIQMKCTLIIQWWNALILPQSYFLISHQRVAAILDATKNEFIKVELQGQNWITFYVLMRRGFRAHAQIELVNTEQIANNSGFFLFKSPVCPALHCLNMKYDKKEGIILFSFGWFVF